MSFRFFRYEDIALDLRGFLGDLFGFLEIPAQPAELDDLAERKSFQQATGGHAQGEEDIHAHMRKGNTGRLADGARSERARPLAPGLGGPGAGIGVRDMTVRPSISEGDGNDGATQSLDRTPGIQR